VTARPYLAREAGDALLLALAAAMVPATWRLLLGWSWPDLIAGHDGIATVFLAIRELVEAHGRWSELAYRADLFGGMKVRDAIGPLPILALLARLPLSPTAVFNVFTFVIQAIIAFLGVRTATDLAATWSPGPRASGLERAAGVWMCGFAPALAWRLGHGHHTLVVGGLPFLAAAALLVAAGAGTVTVTLVIVATAALVNGILFTGHQMVLYGAVFGGPILLGLWKSSGGRPRALLALACLAALLVALPGFWGVLAHAAGTDSLRALGRMRLTYAWLTSEPLDWIASIPWTRGAVPFRRPVLFHHEVNYAAGPLLALLALVPWRRARALALGLGASVTLVLLFSMDVRPFSDALLALVPPLNTFRVPPRAILPALGALPVLALAAVLARRDRAAQGGAAVLALAAGGVFFMLPSLAREAVGWAVVLGLVLQVFQQIPRAAASLRPRRGGAPGGREGRRGGLARPARPRLAARPRHPRSRDRRIRRQHRLRGAAVVARGLFLSQPPFRGAGLRAARPGIPAEPADRPVPRGPPDVAADVPALRRGLDGAGTGGGGGPGRAAHDAGGAGLVQRGLHERGLLPVPRPRPARAR